MPGPSSHPSPAPPPSGVRLAPWGPEDRALLHRLLGDPAMTAHLGGPETAAAIDARHERYLAAPDGLFRILHGAAGAGWVGYWEHAWDGREALEIGWAVLPEHQGRGVAAAATVLALAHAARHAGPRVVHAFPAEANAASNALCRRLGFTDGGPCAFEYPKGSVMACRDWWLDLDRFPPGSLAAT